MYNSEESEITQNIRMDNTPAAGRTLPIVPHRVAHGQGAGYAKIPKMVKV